MTFTKRSLIEALENLDVEDDAIVVRVERIGFEDVREVRSQTIQQVFPKDCPEVRAVVLE